MRSGEDELSREREICFVESEKEKRRWTHFANSIKTEERKMSVRGNGGVTGQFTVK